MAALTATVALYRALVRKGLMPRDEAMQILLGEAKGNPEIHRRAPLMTHGVSGLLRRSTAAAISLRTMRLIGS
jgi:hypothetical protein